MQFIDFINLGHIYILLNGHVFKMWGFLDVCFAFKCL